VEYVRALPESSLRLRRTCVQAGSASTEWLLNTEPGAVATALNERHSLRQRFSLVIETSALTGDLFYNDSGFQAGIN